MEDITKNIVVSIFLDTLYFKTTGLQTVTKADDNSYRSGSLIFCRQLTELAESNVTSSIQPTKTYATPATQSFQTSNVMRMFSDTLKMDGDKQLLYYSKAIRQEEIEAWINYLRTSSAVDDACIVLAASVRIGCPHSENCHRTINQ